MVGSAYSYTVQAQGGTPPYSWSISAGALPSGLSLSSGGALTGTPSAAGNYTNTLRVTDAVSATASQSR